MRKNVLKEGLHELPSCLLAFQFQSPTDKITLQNPVFLCVLSQSPWSSNLAVTHILVLPTRLKTILLWLSTFSLAFLMWILSFFLGSWARFTARLTHFNPGPPFQRAFPGRGEMTRCAPSALSPVASYLPGAVVSHLPPTTSSSPLSVLYNPLHDWKSLPNTCFKSRFCYFLFKFWPRKKSQKSPFTGYLWKLGTKSVQ